MPQRNRLKGNAVQRNFIARNPPPPTAELTKKYENLIRTRINPIKRKRVIKNLINFESGRTALKKIKQNKKLLFSLASPNGVALLRRLERTAFGKKFFFSELSKSESAQNAFVFLMSSKAGANSLSVIGESENGFNLLMGVRRVPQAVKTIEYLGSSKEGLLALQNITNDMPNKTSSKNMLIIFSKNPGRRLALEKIGSTKQGLHTLIRISIKQDQNIDFLTSTAQGRELLLKGDIEKIDEAIRAKKIV